MRDEDIYIDREDRAIASNTHAYFGVSEYDGIVCLWLVAKDPNSALARHWCKQQRQRLIKTFGTLRYHSRFSSGQSVYQQV